MVPDNRASIGCFGHPLCDEAFRELTLRVFVIQQEPLMSSVERALHARELHFARIASFASGQSLIEPKPGAHLHRAALTLLVQQKEKLNRMDEVRSFAEKALSLSHRLPNEADFSMLQVTQPAVDDASGAAGHAGREIILLDQQSALSGEGAFARNRDPIDPAANNDDVEMLSFNRWSWFDC